ncbi:unnamed protein product, partial [Soboliphyme baturini]|uniref:Uncharacterized protein n=1 Tax=Soboliphyme baturini TaxID=241478 RepID=A0A183JA30_9BILA
MEADDVQRGTAATVNDQLGHRCVEWSMDDDPDRERERDRDWTDFVRLCKFFTLRMAQIVVQSRHGRRIRTETRQVSSNSDWFSLKVNDVQEVNDVVKAALADRHL